MQLASKDFIIPIRKKKSNVIFKIFFINKMRIKLSVNLSKSILKIVYYKKCTVEEI